MNKILKGDVPLLPIVQKNFARIQPNEGAWEEYFYLMRNIPDWKERLVIMLYPVMSILSSVLKENNFQLMTSLNLILVKDFPIRHILSWFQVFNRDKLKLMDDSITNSALMKESLLLKDEVLIVDLREHEGETYYQKTSRSRKYKKLVRYMEQGEIVSGLVGVSNNIVFDARVFNFYIDDRYTTTVSGEEAMRGEKAIEVFFSCLVDFVERKMDTVIDCLRTNRKYGEENHRNDLENIQKLLARFAPYETLKHFYVKRRVVDKKVAPVTIIQISELPELEKRFVAKLLIELFWKEVKQRKNSHGVIVLDEIQFLLEKDKGAFFGIMREGRKFGLKAYMGTQFISEYKKEVIESLLQAGNILIFKPTARDMIFSARVIDEERKKSWRKILGELEVGEAVIMGNYFLNSGKRRITDAIVCRI